MAWSVVASDRLDGIASVAIILRAARIRNTAVRIHWFPNVPKTTEPLFLIDFSPDEMGQIPEKIAYWSCHQSISQKNEVEARARTKFPDFVGPMHSCSAELVQRRFLPNDSVAQTIAGIARDVEFWLRKDENSAKISDLIASGFEKRTIAESLSRGVYWTDIWEKERIAYLDKKQNALDEMMKNISIKHYGTLRIGFALSQNFVGSADACQYMIDKHDGIDIATVIFRDGRVAFRKRDNCTASCEELAKTFNGGGQVFAAGAKLPYTNVTNGMLQDIIFFIDRTLQDFLSKDI